MRHKEACCNKIVLLMKDNVFNWEYTLVIPALVIVPSCFLVFVFVFLCGLCTCVC